MHRSALPRPAQPVWPAPRANGAFRCPCWARRTHVNMNRPCRQLGHGRATHLATPTRRDSAAAAERSAGESRQQAASLRRAFQKRSAPRLACLATRAAPLVLSLAPRCSSSDHLLHCLRWIPQTVPNHRWQPCCLEKGSFSTHSCLVVQDYYRSDHLMHCLPCSVLQVPHRRSRRQPC